MPALSRIRHVVPATIALALIITGCGSPAVRGTPARNASIRPGTTMPAMNGMGQTPAATPDGMNGMSGMGPMAGGNGLSAAADGYRMTSRVATLPAGAPAAYTFSITAPDGSPLTSYVTDQTKKLHFYAIRSDLTGFQHIHPAMTSSGAWTASLAGLKPGRWRLYAAFTPAAGPATGTEFLLSRSVTVPGPYAAAPLQAPAAATTDDGYTITTVGDLMPGMAMPLTITITRHGQPVTTLQPYLGTYAHLTAIHAGDLAFAHLHPEGATHGNHGGPALTFDTNLPETGPWRLFLQFQTNGRVHTAPITVNL